MAIWFRDYTIESIQDLGKNNMVEHLGIELLELGDNYIKGRMPVDKRTKQPTGVLHGGATAALAETLGSIGGNLVIDMNNFTCVGYTSLVASMVVKLLNNSKYNNCLAANIPEMDCI